MVNELLKEMVDREAVARFPQPDYRLKQHSSYNRASTLRGGPGWFADSDGVGFIRGKETDRIRAVVTELQRLGVDATEDPDGFTVQPFAVAHTIFDGMTKGMAKVKQGTFAALAFVSGDDICLGLTGDLYSMAQGLLVSIEQVLHVAL